MQRKGTPYKFTILGLHNIDATRMRKVQNEVEESNKMKITVRRSLKMNVAVTSQGDLQVFPIMLTV